MNLASNPHVVEPTVSSFSMRTYSHAILADFQLQMMARVIHHHLTQYLEPVELFGEVRDVFELLMRDQVSAFILNRILLCFAFNTLCF